MIFTNWWFWILIIGLILAVVGLILFFATEVNRITTYILIGIGVVFLLIGVVFAIKSRGQNKNQGFAERWLPGSKEARFFAERTGLANAERAARAKTMALGRGAVAGVKGAAVKSKNLVTDPRTREILKKQAIITLAMGSNPVYATVGAGATIANLGTVNRRVASNKQKQQKRDLAKQQKELAFLENEARLHQGKEALEQQKQLYNQQFNLPGEGGMMPPSNEMDTGGMGMGGMDAGGMGMGGGGMGLSGQLGSAY